MFLGLRVARMDGGKACLAFLVTEIKPREVIEVGFSDDDFLAVLQLDQQRKEGQFLVIHLAQVDTGIGVLEGVVELLVDDVAFLSRAS